MKCLLFIRIPQLLHRDIPITASTAIKVNVILLFDGG